MGTPHRLGLVLCTGLALLTLSACHTYTFKLPTNLVFTGQPVWFVTNSNLVQRGVSVPMEQINFTGCFLTTQHERIVSLLAATSDEVLSDFEDGKLSVDEYNGNTMAIELFASVVRNLGCRGGELADKAPPSVELPTVVPGELRQLLQEMQAERRKLGERPLSREQIRDFLDRFLPRGLDIIRRMRSVGKAAG